VIITLEQDSGTLITRKQEELGKELSEGKLPLMDLGLG
jgi:hypothetical protein